MSRLGFLLSSPFSSFLVSSFSSSCFLGGGGVAAFFVSSGTPVSEITVFFGFLFLFLFFGASEVSLPSVVFGVVHQADVVISSFFVSSFAGVVMGKNRIQRII